MNTKVKVNIESNATHCQFVVCKENHKVKGSCELLTKLHFMAIMLQL